MKITIYEQFKNDHKATKEHYNQFINRFPDHELTPGFQTLLPYIGREEVYLDSVRQAKVITDSILN